MKKLLTIPILLFTLMFSSTSYAEWTKVSQNVNGVFYVDFINGLVCRKGIESGVPTPANDAAVEFVKRLEKGELSPDPVNVVRLESHMAT